MCFDGAESACRFANSYTYGETLGSSLAELGYFSYSEDECVVRNLLGLTANAHRSMTRCRGFVCHEVHISCS